MSRQPCDALLLDLDGVLRVFDPAHVADVERRYGLAPGILTATAFQPDRLRAAVTGRISHHEWLSGVAEALGGSTPVRAAVTEWGGYPGAVQPDVLAVVRELRAAGVRVGIGSNATDRLPADLAGLGLRHEVDMVLNSSELGYAKPDPRFFAAACAALDTDPGQCLFVDDDARNVRGARQAGLAALRYTGPADLRYVRAAVRAPA